MKNTSLSVQSVHAYNLRQLKSFLRNNGRPKINRIENVSEAVSTACPATATHPLILTPISPVLAQLVLGESLFVSSSATSQRRPQI